jgi:CCR4-NOT transcription complex subunit 6
LPLSFSVASYNLLASAYIQRAWYRRSPALVLDPAWRVPALVDHVSKLGADIFCLQEVEPETFVALRTTLLERGYGAHYERKLAGRPEGLALFYRRKLCELRDMRMLAYADGDGDTASDSGYIALFGLFRMANRILGLVNTHLMWDAPNSVRRVPIGLRQAQQLLAELQTRAAEAQDWIVSGDFNATPESEIVSRLRQAGFHYAHEGLTGSATCNVNADARMIDYLFFSAGLSAEPRRPVSIDERTVLPSAEQPSDHIALMAQFDWQD